MYRSIVASACYFAAMQITEASVYIKCYGEYCFFITNNSNPTLTTLSGTVEECNQHHASLLTIPNVDVQNKLRQFVTEGRTSGSIPSTPTDVWLKATKYIGPTWTWVNGQVYDVTPSGQIMDQGTASYDNTYAYLGNGTRDPSKSQLYGYHAFNPRFYWALYICEIYDATVDTCSSQYNGNLLNGRCFKTGELSGSIGETWFDARNACLAHGDLASFNNIDVNTLRTVSWLDPTKTYWIGLNRNKWTVGGMDDPEVKYTNWFQANPANYDYSCICVSLTDMTWVDCDCNNNNMHGVICYNYSALNVATTSAPALTTNQRQTTPSRTTSTSIPDDSEQNSSSTNHPAAANGDQCGGSDKLGAGIGIGIAIGVCAIVIVEVVVFFCCKLTRRETAEQEKQNKNPIPMSPMVEDRLYESSTHQQSTHVYDGLQRETPYEQI